MPKSPWKRVLPLPGMRLHSWVRGSMPSLAPSLSPTAPHPVPELQPSSSILAWPPREPDLSTYASSMFESSFEVRFEPRLEVNQEDAVG